MPFETIDAYQDHGTPLPQPFGPSEVEAAQRDLDRLKTAGIDMDDVTKVLEDQGVEKFAKSWEDLLAEVERKRQAIV
jgi:transaldolase